MMEAVPTAVSGPSEVCMLPATLEGGEAADVNSRCLQSTCGLRGQRQQGEQGRSDFEISACGGQGGWGGGRRQQPLPPQHLTVEGEGSRGSRVTLVDTFFALPVNWGQGDGCEQKSSGIGWNL